MLHCIWGDKMKILKPKDVANMLNNKKINKLKKIAREVDRYD